MFFIHFLFENTEIRPCTWYVLPRRDAIKSNAWVHAQTFACRRRHTFFSHMYFSYWLVFLCWTSNFSSQCATGNRIRFLASGLYSWLGDHRDHRTGHRPSYLHCLIGSAGVLEEYPASEELASVNRTLTRPINGNMDDLSCYMFISFQSCLLLRLSIWVNLDPMGFHQAAFGPPPQQNHVGGRGD